MEIKIKTKPQDLVEGPSHKGLTRRDLLKRGLATGALSVVLPKMFGADLAKAASTGTPLQCPVQVQDSDIGSPGNGLAGLYLSAHKFISGGSIPNSLVKRLQALNLAPIPSKLTII